jgi:tryptophan 2,3-dioxygenase
MSSTMNYREYIGLEALLGSVRPISSSEESAVWAAERFFIVVHQVSELWASQAFVDLARAHARSEERDFSGAASALGRVTGVLALLKSTLSQLEQLDIANFRAFRPLLQGISAAESEQFLRLLDLHKHPAVLGIQRAARAATTQSPGSAEAQLARSLLEETERLSGTVQKWRVGHVAHARRFIGNEPGTGGSEGVSYLERRAFGEQLGLTTERRSR